MKILITGCYGQVGTELCQQAEAKGYTPIGRDVDTLDITDADGLLQEVRNVAPDVIINAAAYTAVDRAEEDSAIAYAVNDTGSANLARAATDLNIPLLHISTDYVFDGDDAKAYREDDPVSPLGVYGLSKEAGEQRVRDQVERHIVLRTAWVFGIEGNNFVKTMVRLGAERDELGVVVDQVGCPTFAADIASALLTVVDRLAADKPVAWGTYHFTSSESVSWFEFALAIFDEAVEQGVLAKAPEVNGIPTSDYPTPAKRPANSVLDCSKFCDTFPEQPLSDWRSGLSRLITTLK